MENRVKKLEDDVGTIREDIVILKISVTKMAEVDNNIFDKLREIQNTFDTHKNTFANHDKKEMEKYSSIDKRLAKIEKLIYMVFGAGALFQSLQYFHLLKL